MKFTLGYHESCQSLIGLTEQQAEQHMANPANLCRCFPANLFMNATSASSVYGDDGERRLDQRGSVLGI